MPKNRNTGKILKTAQRLSVKTYSVLKLSLPKIWGWIGHIWNHPLVAVLVGAAVLIAAMPLFNLITQETFKPYLNCAHLISKFCDGYKIQSPIWPNPSITLPGLGNIVNPPLELLREIIAWSIIIIFVFLSLYLTFIINSLKAIVKLLTLDKEQWKSFLAGLRTWFLIFVSLCLLFYYFVVR